MNIYNKEILELKREILIEINNELRNTINFKIKTNTKAYKELEKTIFQWDLKIDEITDNINKNDINQKFSLIKIDIKTLESLIDLNNKLNFESIAELLDSLIINYEDIFLRDTLVEIKSFDLSKKTQAALNNTDLYICELFDNEYGIKSNEKILYKIDDVKIYDNKEYINAKKMKKYPFGEDIFWISLNCTLSDIEKFNSLFFLSSNNK